MAFKETFETVHETELEVQKFLTYLKEHSHASETNYENEKLVKAYKEESEIEGRLKFLIEFLEEEKGQTEKELKVFKQGLAMECLGMKCKQIENRIQAEFATDEDYGEEY